MKQVMVLALVVGAFTAGFAEVGLAQDAPPPTQEKKDAPPEAPAQPGDTLPRPPEGWWEEVDGGEFAVYDMAQMGMQLKLKLAVVSRQDSQITVTTTAEVPGMPQGGMPPQTDTIDAAKHDQLAKMPEGATVKKLGEETITAAGREWACGVYEIEGKDDGRPIKMKLWHSPELLPIFSGGAVKMEVEATGPAGPMTITMQLAEVGTATAGEGAPAPAPAQGGEKKQGE